MVEINLPNFITIALIAILAILIFGTVKRSIQGNKQDA